MPNPTIRIHDLATNEVIDRPMTAAEMKEAEAEKLAYASIEAELQSKATAKSVLLERLGITADEAALLIS